MLLRYGTAFAFKKTKKNLFLAYKFRIVEKFIH